MTELRKLTVADAALLRSALYPQLEVDQVRQMILQWDQGEVDGKKFEMLAVIRDSQIAGTVSLYQQEGAAVSFGIEIAENFRRCGIATEAGKMAICYAAKSGYQKMVSQVRQDNAASIALHARLGFLLTEGTVNRKGNPVFLYERKV